MKYYVTLAGLEHEVDLQTDADGKLTAELNGQCLAVNLAAVDPGQRYSVLLNDRSFDVIVHFNGERTELSFSGRSHGLTVEDERQRAARQIGAQAPKGPTTMLSMMPGILREVRVQVGDIVEQGQTLAILEAMKMENEVTAEAAGVVREVMVSAGATVEGGVALVALDPLPED